MAEIQDNFLNVDHTLVPFDKYLSSERLAPYLDQARGDMWVAIRLHERNRELSEALYGVIQGLELTLKNAFHGALTDRLGSPDWYDKFTFQDSEHYAITETKDKIRERGAAVTSARVVAELNFSFWVRLSSFQYEDTLWFPCLVRLFPIRIRRPKVQDRLKNLKTLRNRIAHHQRILYKRNLEADYVELIETIGWISSDMRKWVEHTNCFLERYAKRLPEKPEIASIPIAITEATPNPSVLPDSFG
jgi:hypothetical protein